MAIVGLGYVGLPLALLFCSQKLKVIAYDEDAGRVKLLKAGKSPIRHVAGDRIAEAVRARRLFATTRAQDLGAADAVILCVPTPLTKQREPRS